MSNAVKYNSESGSIQINSELVNEKQVRILFADTGKGLTKDEIARLFNPFERLNKESNVEGTGIGLTITQHLIEVMGGNIGVECGMGKGCTFWIDLVLVKDK